MNNSEKFKKVFGIYAEEFWAKPEKEMLDWIAEETEPERKRGYWVPVTNGRGGFECDQCHNYAPSYQNGDEYLSYYCPNCGAEMRMRGE